VPFVAKILVTEEQSPLIIQIKYYSETEDLTFYGSFKHEQPSRKLNEVEMTDRPTMVKVYPKLPNKEGTFGAQGPFFNMTFVSDKGIRVSIKPVFAKAPNLQLLVKLLREQNASNMLTKAMQHKTIEDF
jgi:hypothetical protein